MFSGIGNWIRNVSDATAHAEKTAERPMFDDDTENRDAKRIENLAADRRDRRNVFAGRHAILVAGFQSEIDHETRLGAEVADGPTKGWFWRSGARPCRQPTVA